jgi:hypothetical protein
LPGTAQQLGRIVSGGITPGVYWKLTDRLNSVRDVIDNPASASTAGTRASRQLRRRVFRFPTFRAG